jgi:hypothetical protein
MWEIRFRGGRQAASEVSRQRSEARPLACGGLRRVDDRRAGFGVAHWRNGHVVGQPRIDTSDDDESTIEEARLFIDVDAIELWEGLGSWLKLSR